MANGDASANASVAEVRAGSATAAVSGEEVALLVSPMVTVVEMGGQPQRSPLRGARMKMVPQFAVATLGLG